MTRNIIWQDLEFFLTRLRNLPVSKSLTLDANNNSFCVSTGCSFESWVYYPERVNNPEIVKHAIKFFADENISFMWPLYNGGEKVLEDCGLVYAGDLTAMSYAPKTQEHKANVDVDYREWAKTAWRGFDYEGEGVSKNYYELVKAFNDDENLSPSLYYEDGKPAGTYLLTNEENLAGVYYFATIPEFRRRGIARRMMTEICTKAQGKTIVLQATPMGKKFYESFGFEERFIIPVYSTEADIF